jgi:hypothetical protein
MILFQLEEPFFNADVLSLLLEGRERPTVQTLDLIFGETFSTVPLQSFRIFIKYPNLKSLTLRLDIPLKELRRVLNACGTSTQLARLHLTYLSNNGLKDYHLLSGFKGLLRFDGFKGEITKSPKINFTLKDKLDKVQELCVL